MDKQEFDVEILSHDLLTSMKVEWLEVMSPTGSFVVAFDHAPIISLLKKGSLIVFFKDGRQEQMEAVGGGIVHIQSGKPVIISLWNGKE